jgi:integrase/recombinase XerC
VRAAALHPRIVQDRLQRLRSAGLPVTATPHALRHELAPSLAGGGDLRAIQEL